MRKISDNEPVVMSKRSDLMGPDLGIAEQTGKQQHGQVPGCCFN